MADLGSIIALAEAACKLIKYVKSARHAPDEWKDLEKEVTNSANILKGLREQLQADRLHIQLVQQCVLPLFATEGPLATLEAALKKINAALDIPDSRRKEFYKTLTWPLKSGEIRELLSQIGRSKGDILVIFNQVRIRLDIELLEDTKVLREDTTILKDDTAILKDDTAILKDDTSILKDDTTRLRADTTTLKEYASGVELGKVLQSISPLEFIATQQLYHQKAFPGTMRWFLNGPPFRGWAENRAPVLLWCHWTAGAGKTVLASTAFEELKTMNADGNAAVLVAYCHFDNVETQSAAKILSAYLKQVVEMRSEVSRQVRTLYANHQGRPPLAEDKICAVLSAELKKFERVFFILDGLDEMSNDWERKLLLERLQAMAPCPKLLVTSQPLRDLNEWFYKTSMKGLYRIEDYKHSVELPGHLHAGCVGIPVTDHTTSGQKASRSIEDTWRLSGSYRCRNCKELICVYCYDAHDTCLGCRRPRTSYE